MRLAIRHRTLYRYEPAVAAAAMRVKLFPSRYDAQTPLSWSVSANGAALPPEFRNGWGDEEATTLLRGGGIEAVEIVAEGEVETTDAAGVVKGFRCALRPGACLRETPRTRPSDGLRALAAEAEAAEASPLGRAHALMALTAERVAYRSGATDFHATAAEALTAGEGVCQDLTHVMIAAARALGWPARYVCGYFLSEAAEGELATHAWAELWIDGLGWVGFDPTHGMCPTDAHVRLCAGLDAADAAPLRGHVEGQAEETLEARVDIAAAGQSQRQQ